MLVEIGLGLIIAGLTGMALKSDSKKDKQEGVNEEKITEMLTFKNNKVCGDRELKSLSGDGVQLSSKVRLSVKQSNEHVLLISPSGGGKSTRFIAPNINQLTNCSMVVTDPVGELERKCRTNKKVYVFNPFKDNSIGYDPLLNCKSEFEVRKMARTILTNGCKSTRQGETATNHQDWVEMAIPLFTSYLLYCYHTKKYNFAEVVRNITTMPILPIPNENIDSIYSEIMSGKYDSAKIEFHSFAQVNKAPQTLSGIRTTLNTCLEIFFDDNLQHIFTKPNMDFAQLRKEESVLYIQIPERHSEYYAPLTATLVSQLFDSLLDNEGLQTYMFFDEFSNIGILPDICKLLATARKHCLSIVAAIQSLTQLSRVYGEIEGKELQELFKTVICTSSLKDSAEYISNLLGTKDIYYEGSYRTKPLMSPDEIRRMNKDDLLIICNNKRPVKDTMLPFVS